MSRFACPPELSDQKLIWSHLESAASMCSGKGEYGLANELWALCARIKDCATHGHRYVRMHTEPGTVKTCSAPEMHKTGAA